MKKDIKQPKIYLNYDNLLPNVDVIGEMQYPNTLPEAVVYPEDVQNKLNELKQLKDPLAMPTLEDFILGNLYKLSKGKIKPLPKKLNPMYYMLGLPLYDGGTDPQNGIDYIDGYYGSAGYYARRRNLSPESQLNWRIGNNPNWKQPGEIIRDALPAGLGLYFPKTNTIELGIPNPNETPYTRGYRGILKNQDDVIAAHERAHNWDQLHTEEGMFPDGKSGFTPLGYIPQEYEDILNRGHAVKLNDRVYKKDAKRYAKETYDFRKRLYGGSFDDYLKAYHGNIDVEYDDSPESIAALETRRKEYESGVADLQSMSKRKYKRRLKQEYILDRHKDVSEHDQNVHEKYADLLATRYLLNKEGIYDASAVDENGNPVEFTKKHLQKFKKSKSWKSSRFGHMFDDDDFINAMNLLASYTPTDDQSQAFLYYADKGKSIKPIKKHKWQK